MTIQNEQCIEKERNHLNEQIEKGGSSGIKLKKDPPKIAQEQSDFLKSYISKNTKENYKRGLLEFLEFCRERGEAFESVSEIKRFHVDSFKEELLRKFTPTTVYAKLAPVLSFLKFSFAQDWLPKNFASQVKLPRINKAKGKTEALSEDKLLKILENLEQGYKKASNPQGNKEDYKAHLKYVLFATLAEIGMRATELTGLKIKDVDFTGKHPRIHMQLKGGVLHSPLISDGLSCLLKNYIESLRIGAKPYDPLFTIHPYAKKNLSRQHLAIIIKNIANENGIEKEITPHSLRATVASLLHQRNVPIGEIQQLLGHRSILTTMMYVRMTDEEKQSAGRKLNLINNK